MSKIISWNFNNKQDSMFKDFINIVKFTITYLSGVLVGLGVLGCLFVGIIHLFTK